MPGVMMFPLGGSKPVVTLTTISVFGSRTSPGTATSGNVGASAVGGVAPYTFNWSYVSGDNTMTPSSSTGTPINFSAHVGVNEEKDAIWQVVCVDSASNSSLPAQVSISLLESSFD